MNAQTQATTVTALLDPTWHVVISEHIAAFPASIGLVVEPNALGQFDAEQGLPCDPLARGYTTLGDIEMYLIAFKDTTALWASIVEQVNDGLEARHADARRILTDEEAAAETDDYCDWMDFMDGLEFDKRGI